MNQINQNNFTFESQNLVVDWISFNFQSLDKYTMIQIATYLSKIGFNSYQQSGKLAKPIKESILANFNNRFEVLFLEEGPYWQGVILQFSGSNAAHFYTLIQQQYISWELFSSAILGRFDIFYSRPNKRYDKPSIDEFFHHSHRKLKQTNKNVSFEKNNKGLILKIGNRRSNHYSRIYQDNHSLKFEYEIKGPFLREYHCLLIENRLEEFETQLSKRFFYHFASILPLQYSYLDWLVLHLRPIRKQKFIASSLKLHYLEPDSLWTDMDRKDFFNFLQFIVYAQTLDYEIGTLWSTSYRRVFFPVHHFLKYKKESQNYYQLKKLVDFFHQLQKNSLIKFYSDTQYQSLVTIPKVNVEKGKQNSWIAEVWIAEDLFYYSHPFIFPDFLKRKSTKYQFEVQFKIIQVFSTIDIQKIFDIKDFLQTYSATLSNQDQTNIKEYFIELIQILLEQDLIEPKYTILSDGNLYQTHQLTTSNISEGFIVYEKLSF